MQKRTGVSLMVFAVMAAALVSVHIITFSAKARVASLNSVKGTVTVTPAQGEARAAANGMAVNEGDTVKTAGGGSVIIRFDDGSMIKLGPLSNMKLGKLSGAGQKNTTEVDVDSGKVWSRVNKLDKDSSFKVKTPSAIAGVRGTYYSSEVDQDATSRFDVFDGEVAVASTQNPSQEISVKANQTTTVAQGKSPTAPAVIPKDRLEQEKNGFSEGEAVASTFDVQIEVSPQVIVPGGKAVVTIRVLKNGAPYQQEVQLHLKLGGAAVFAAGVSNEADVTTDGSGVATAEVTGGAEENVSVDVSLKLQVKKKK